MRNDHDLGFLLRYENVAWYDNGRVRILDRRVYPREISFVTCETSADVAQAIGAMVTQSAGPYTAAAMGMILAYRESQKAKDAAAYLEKAAYHLSHARPTTVIRMEQVVQGCMNVLFHAMDSGKDPEQALVDYNLFQLEKRYGKMEEVSAYLVDLIPDQSTVMTQCFGETIVGMMIRTWQERHKMVKMVCPETRPFLQGARLTASVAADMEVDTTVITDNMVGSYMKNHEVALFTSAADSICMDGYVINKVGTYQMSILAHYHEIPYFVTGIPDVGHRHVEDVAIEYRNPEETLSCHGIKHTHEKVKGLYPSFDITPPHLIKGVVTDVGIFSPYDLTRYQNFAGGQFYL